MKRTYEAALARNLPSNLARGRESMGRQLAVMHDFGDHGWGPAKGAQDQASARYRSRGQRNDSGYDHRYYSDLKRVQDKEHQQPPPAVPAIAVVSGTGGTEEEGKHRRSAQE